MKQIDHDAKEKRPRYSPIVVIIMSIVLGVGVAVMRGDLAGTPASEIPLIILGGVAIAGSVFGVGYLLCKSWDWLWSKITGRASR